MSENQNESFIRWQDISIHQLGAVNNLFIGLATGLLAFQTQLAFDQEVNLLPWETLIMAASLIFLFLSILVGCYLAWNRLSDFRLTAQIARKREKDQRGDIAELRCKSKYLGNLTWSLIQWQAVLFALGSLVLLIVTIGRYVG
jgi:hypothetical protein